ncbi:MAG: glycosyltransferase family 2 protein [Flavobacteriales bacterium]|nr:glycosyltransferase family 2 protein [Bacteroidota bacterium]MCB9239557.1 glycosyltransferase family 2 protein [Flavobacteriales bacterium]
MRSVPFPITAVILAKNEEAVMAECIESIRDVVDEVLVIDSGSTDETKNLAEAAGAIVLNTEWLGYSDTKNWGNLQASHDLIFSLDADERADAQLRTELSRVRQDGFTGIGAFRRKNYYGHHWVRYGGWYPDWKSRLFDRRTTRWEGKYVHERLIGRQPQVELNGNIIHLTVRDRTHHRQTIEKYARLNAQRLVDAGKSSHGLAALLSTCWTFARIFFLKAGFLDGVTGWYVAVGSARAKWLRHHYYIELTKHPHG